MFTAALALMPPLLTVTRQGIDTRGAVKSPESSTQPAEAHQVKAGTGEVMAFPNWSSAAAEKVAVVPAWTVAGAEGNRGQDLGHVHGCPVLPGKPALIGNRDRKVISPQGAEGGGIVTGRVRAVVDRVAAAARRNRDVGIVAGPRVRQIRFTCVVRARTSRVAVVPAGSSVAEASVAIVGAVFGADGKHVLEGSIDRAACGRDYGIERIA